VPDRGEELTEGAPVETGNRWCFLLIPVELFPPAAGLLLQNDTPEPVPGGSPVPEAKTVPFLACVPASPV
jgi:hypothetical protein